MRAKKNVFYRVVDVLKPNNTFVVVHQRQRCTHCIVLDQYDLSQSRAVNKYNENSFPSSRPISPQKSIGYFHQVSFLFCRIVYFFLSYGES